MVLEAVDAGPRLVPRVSAAAVAALVPRSELGALPGLSVSAPGLVVGEAQAGV